jgi:PilZ domain
MSASKNETVWNAARTARRYVSLRDLSVMYEGSTEDVAQRLPDISTRGMFINTNRRFPEGAVLNVKFRLALSGVEVQARAEVRYCLAGVGVGVEFVEISRAAVSAIEKEVALGYENQGVGRELARGGRSV